MHVIRLRSAWQLERLATGGTRCRRAFHKPTGLDTGERVWLVVEAPRGRTVVQLNGQRLGEVPGSLAAGRFDLTERLDDGNVVEIDVECEAAAEAEIGDLVGEVRLEIEERTGAS